ncbi:MAG TPA: protease pro-enzyme activation domain-containing protein [Bryobacteraceae bacterium]|jgi:uncharacterized protein (TIGR03437 family)|nr:protease pro-enzyme activation domain-containing protein [Bryobacteraceae bacterium]
MNLRQTLITFVIGASASVGFAQPKRILSKIDVTKTLALPGRVHPLATAANDAGEVASSFRLPGMTVMLKPTVAQQANLQQLLQDQQNPSSPRYRQWLTPEQYADQFGVSASDLAQVTSWLESQGFAVNPASRSRTFISFSGTAGQVQGAFHTTIHNYRVNGEMHYANSTDLTIPAALSPIVSGVRGLHDFRPKPNYAKVRPNYTLGAGDHAMVPDDFAAIYDITPMYSAGTNAAGQKVAIMGQSAIHAADITTFWTRFGLSSATLTQVLVNRENPGILSGDVDESALDLEWAGAVARNANIVFVYSYSVWDSATYAVDNAVAPVISMSYGNCENYDLVDLPSYRQLVQQANAEGITWLAASGDQGATDCDAGAAVAENGLQVDEPGSIPEVTSMGGTSVSNAGAYWNSTNTSTYSSAKGYVPEVAWNESSQAGSILGTGGGASAYFSQPAWQTSAGVPNDGWRHVPDISFNSSVYSVPYYVYCTVCGGASVEYVGGTSAATPTMAGVVAMLNQYLKTGGLGNINPTLYNLFQTAPSAFHSNITGDNMEACAWASPGCQNGQEGYTATGSGYSSVVGLGSLDITKLIQNWQPAQSTRPIVVASLDQNPVYQGIIGEGCGNANTWNFRITLTEEAGVATSIPAFSINGTDYSAKIASTFGTATLGARQSLSGCMALATVGAPTNEAFNFSGSDWSTALNVSFQGRQTQLAVAGVTNAASYAQSYAPGMILAVFGAGMGTLAQSAATLPLPYMMSGVEAYMCPVNCNTSSTVWYVPLYYVGPNQVNIQIPYEASGAVDLNIANPYQTTDYFFTVSPIAPGIFTFLDGSSDVNPSRTASAGQTTFLYITGEGAVSPSLADGESPSAGTPLTQLPKPREAVTVTVGGIQSPQISFVGIPSGLVGVTQVNFVVPSNVPSGRQPVIVTVGTVATPPAYITIQ